jgi:hypothetical protein
MFMASPTIDIIFLGLIMTRLAATAGGTTYTALMGISFTEIYAAKNDASIIDMVA